MKALTAVFKRELAGYFAAPTAYVFMVIFLALCGIFTFAQGLGGFFDRGQADLAPFFGFLPWLYLFLIPALSMRLWAEERRGGTVELLFTLPVPSWAAVLGKYLAVWVFTGIGLALTFPMWWTVNFLGNPDNGVIAANYVGAFLMAGAYLAIGSAVSAATKSQVIAFVVSAIVTFVFLLLGYGTVLDWLDDWMPPALLDAVSDLSFLTNFQELARGVLELRSIIFFLSVIAAGLVINALLIEVKKAD